jgi:hypothetical protein
MSARRRQERLRHFVFRSKILLARWQISTPLQLLRRLRHNHQDGVCGPHIAKGQRRRQRQDAGVVSVISDDDDEFVPQSDAIGDGDDDNDDDNDSAPWNNKKGKRKDKGKRKATTPIVEDDAAAFRMPATNGANPKVMLISLKAGALGLNLTVANNVYL